MKKAAHVVLLCTLFSMAFAQQSATPKSQPLAVTATQKKEFLNLLKALPHQGEFFTDEAVNRAEPYLPVLLALDEKDLQERDLYPFAAISRGLCDRKQNRDYAVVHFDEIRHPTLRLFWAAMIFDDKAASPEIKLFLRDALKSEQQSETLKEIVGPNFDDFKKRVLAATESRG